MEALVEKYPTFFTGCTDATDQFKRLEAAIVFFTNRMPSEVDLSSLNVKMDHLDRKVGSIASLTNKSAYKGTLSENIVERFISKALPDYSLENTSSIDHSGDFIITDPITSKKVLIDVKDYISPVPLKEIEKIKSDMIERDIRVGTLISLKSHISKHKRFDIEVFDGSRYLLHVPHASEEAIIWSILCCFAIEGKSAEVNRDGILKTYESFRLNASNILIMALQLDKIQKEMLQRAGEMEISIKAIISNMKTLLESTI